MPRPKQQPVDVPRETVIRPIVKDEHSPHPFEVAEREGTLPVFTSIGIAKVGNSHQCVSFVMKSQGDKVLSIEVSDPMEKPYAVEATKTNLVENFVDPDFDGGQI